MYIVQCTSPRLSVYHISNQYLSIYQPIYLFIFLSQEQDPGSPAPTDQGGAKVGEQAEEEEGGGGEEEEGGGGEEEQKTERSGGRF